MIIRKTLFTFFLTGLFFQIVSAQGSDDRFVTYSVNPKTTSVQLYWKDEHGKILGSLQNLKTFVEQKGTELVFAMNGGMYKSDQSAQGLFIQNKIVLAPLDTTSGKGNFYLKPNGIFYITSDSTPHICTTDNFLNDGKIKYATQSGPMLLIDGEIHPAFIEGSKNLNIRNGVGILPDNSVVFVMSRKEINFYDFASFFKSMNCKYALYLDGFVSRAYLSAQQWEQLDGNFGVMIGVTK
jgi:uncharacterized protein YigE (DUF2233 family)